MCVIWFIINTYICWVDPEDAACMRSRVQPISRTVTFYTRLHWINRLLQEIFRAPTISSEINPNLDRIRRSWSDGRWYFNTGSYSNIDRTWKLKNAIRRGNHVLLEIMSPQMRPMKNGWLMSHRKQHHCLCNVMDTIFRLNLSIESCNWIYFITVAYASWYQWNCGRTQLKAATTNQLACPNYSLYVQLLWYPMYLYVQLLWYPMYNPGGMKARVSPVQWSKPHSILPPTQDLNPGGRIQNHKRWPLHYHCTL